MRFQKLFKRVVATGAVTPVDVDPSTLTGNAAAIYNKNDNCCASRVKNIDGYPIQRIAVGAFGPTATFSMKGFIFEELAGLWIQVPLWNAKTTIATGHVGWFDVPVMVDAPKIPGDLSSSNPGAIDFALIVDFTGPPTDGTYQFAIGFDVSNTV